ncbi:MULTISPECIES: FG-GAP-like repeat-containing protein [unclassified Streptomyces]|uniref:FG-GAP-like repeat-containing protein n=1 Tax=unclassified Streptomyces TaxID=2593676 RepID=UPI0033320B4E
MSAEDFALKKAKETGQPYELVKARTQSSDTWAMPTGKWSVKRYGTPVRVRRGGAWVATDPTLQFTANGAVASKAVAGSVTFSGGGTGPFLSGVKDGRTFSLTWPKALPKPTLAGNVATYANVLPDVDLQLKAEIEGFSQLLIVKTAAAAKHPDLATLRFKLDTVGLNVSTDGTSGLIKAVNPAGQDVFTASAPMMWDSTTTAGSASAAKSTGARAQVAAEGTPPAPSDVFVPPSGAKDAQMPTTVSGGTLEIKPDQALLTGAATKYPVYIDPSVAWSEHHDWAWAYRSWPNNSYWNTKQDVRVGYESETNGLSRSFFQLDTANIKGAQITKSTFRIKETWSWSCTATPVELWSTEAISSDTTWNHQPKQRRMLDTVKAAKGRAECAAGNLEFNATSIAQEAASNGWNSLTLGLYAPNESDQYQWKRFDPKTIVLETEYNNPPATPTGLGTSPATSCTEGGVIGNTRIALYAKAEDADGGNLQAEFQLFKAGQSAPVATQALPALRGRVVTWAVPDATLVSGSYSWKVRITDQDNASSAWSSTCTFAVDRDRPSHPPVIGSAQFPDGSAGWPATTGVARTPGSFTFGANGETDLKEIWYYTDDQPRLKSVAPDASVTIVPPGAGPHHVYAYAIDKAGNRSDTATYTYYAKRSNLLDGPGDLNGDGNRDIWTLDAKDQLLTYTGQGNGTFVRAKSEDGGAAFGGAQIAYQGDWDGDGDNDLVSLQYNSVLGKKQLTTYANTGMGTVDNPTGLDVSNQENNHWSNAEQIIASGDLDGDGLQDLLVKQGKQLWAYYGTVFNILDDKEPVLVGNGDWDKFTVIAAGDLNGDKVPDLWLRENATGDLFRTYGSKGPDGNLDPTAWGSTATRVKVGTGFDEATYPSLASVGDITGDGIPDLWARKGGKVVAWPGKQPDANGTSFGAEFVIAAQLGDVPVAGTEVGNGNDRVRWADFDGDGRLDYTLIADDGTVSVWVNNGGDGSGGWKLLGQVFKGATTDRSQVRLADFDGDGKSDYVVVNANGSLSVRLNKGGGEGGWKDIGQVFAGTTTDRTKVRLVDFDGDGKSDYVAYGDAGDVSVHLNKGGDGNGGWQALGKVAGGATPDRSRVRWADSNGDGKADYHVINDNGSIESYLNQGGDGSGGWKALGQVTTGFTANRQLVQLGDFTGDAKADYILAGPNDSATVHAWNGGDTSSSNGWIALGTVMAGSDAHPAPSSAFFHSIKSPTGGWAPFSPLAGVGGAGYFQGSENAITSTPDGSVQVLGTGTDGKLYHVARYPNGSWTKWGAIDGATAGSTWASRDEAIAGMPNGDAQVMSIGSDGRIYHNARYKNGSWQGWNPVSTWSARAVAATGMPNGDLQVVIVGLDGKLYHAARYANGSWQAWNAIDGYQGAAGFAASSVAIAGMPNGDAQFVAVGNDGRQYHTVRFVNGSWQGWSPVGGVDNATSVAITGMSNGDANLVAVAPDGITYHNARYASRSWQGWVAPGFVANDAGITGTGNGEVHVLVSHR